MRNYINVVLEASKLAGYGGSDDIYIVAFHKDGHIEYEVFIADTEEELQEELSKFCKNRAEKVHTFFRFDRRKEYEEINFKRVCEICRKPFYVKMFGQLTCSRQCSDERSRQKVRQNHKKVEH